jgi:hypothetical protein
MITFTAMLQAHPKTKDHVNALSQGKYSVLARRCLTQVSAAKLVEQYGFYPSTPLKLHVSKMLAEICGLTCQDFFNSTDHTGFFIKEIENLRRTLPSASRRWVWNADRVSKAAAASKRKSENFPPFPSPSSDDDDAGSTSLKRTVKFVQV